MNCETEEFGGLLVGTAVEAKYGCFYQVGIGKDFEVAVD